MAESQDTGLATPSPSREQTIVISILVIVAALIVGYYLAVTLITKPKIGLIHLNEEVSATLAEVMAQEINYARNAPDIKGVVLVVDSPGGSASAGHDIYYQVRKLRDDKPVVASMDTLAASAAYQISVAANEIYAKPASIIGNIGVIMGQPQPETLSDEFLTTGPYKATGGSTTSYLQKLDLLHADFRNSVIAERSKAPNPLKLAPEQVATGEIWIGIEAKEHGLIDQLGSLLDAIDRTAQLAGVGKNYQVVEVRDEYLATLQGTELETATALFHQVDSQPKIDLKAKTQKYPSFYQIYVPLE